ncbi:MAG: hypothetical protein ACOZCO_16900 [Bacteroidota bacterium]
MNLISFFSTAQKFFYTHLDSDSGTKATLDLVNYSIYFESNEGELDGLVDVSDKKVPGKKYLRAYYNMGALTDVRSWYPNGNKRTVIRFKHDKSKSSITFKEPLFNLAIKYNLDGKSEFYNEDGSICYVLYYKDNTLVTDSMVIDHKTYAISGNGLKLKDVSIENLLYQEEILDSLQSELKIQKKSAVKCEVFNVNKVCCSVEIDYSGEEKLSTYNKFVQVMKKNMSGVGQLQLNIEEGKISSMEITGEISQKEKEILIKHLSKIVKFASISVDGLNCPKATIFVRFRFGC